ncbi:MAG: hypothetical protein OSW77_12580 [Proteobacteria bacterium]|jgi:hypothetical protein|nr:hypothetical protein [Pseudomonadota bacterium]
MNTLYSDAAQRQLSAVASALAVGRACMVTLNRLAGLNLALGRAALDDHAVALRSLLAADTPGALLAVAAASAHAHAGHCLLYCRTLRACRRPAGPDGAEAPPAGRASL